MSKEMKNMSDAIIEKIQKGEVKMRPKAYFVAGTILTFVGLVSSIVTSVFFFGLIRFFLRARGPMSGYRLEQMISSFPWWIPLVAILGLLIGIWLIRKFDFSYKFDAKIVVAVFIVAVVVSGWLIDVTGVNDTLYQRGPMRGMMRKYLNENYVPFEQGRGMDNSFRGGSNQ